MSQLIKPTDAEWRDWEEICAYTGWNPRSNLKPMRYHGRIIPYNKNLGVGPAFFNELMERVNNVKPIRMAIVGDAGSGKTYTAIDIARIIDKKFSIDQVVMSAKGYMELVRKLKPGQAIVLDEPTFHLAARTWFNEWQRIIVQTIESTRFQNNPLLIPVVNLNLIDKTVREYYTNYVIHVFSRGRGRVYRTKHSQWEDRMIRRTAFDFFIVNPGLELSRCDRNTCLGCVALPKCDKYIWAKYERKRAAMIEYYQQKGEEAIGKAEEKTLTNQQLEKMAFKIKDRLRISEKGHIDHVSLVIAFEDEYDMILPENKAKVICKRLLLRHPEIVGNTKRG